MLSCCDKKLQGPLVVRDVPGYPVEKEGYSGVDPGTVAVITKTDISHLTLSVQHSPLSTADAPAGDAGQEPGVLL